MKWLHVLVQFLILAALTALGASLVTASFSAEKWEVLTSVLSLGRVMAAGTGAAILCLVLLYVLTAVRPRRRERYLSFDAEGGTVRMSTAAIADYVQKLSSEFPSIVRMKPSVIPLRRAIDIRVDVQVKAGPQIHEVCDLLQRRVRERVTGGLGISEIRRVVVSVSDVLSEHKPQ